MSRSVYRTVPMEIRGMFDFYREQVAKINDAFDSEEKLLKETYNEVVETISNIGVPIYVRPKLPKKKCTTSLRRSKRSCQAVSVPYAAPASKRITTSSKSKYELIVEEEGTSKSSPSIDVCEAPSKVETPAKPPRRRQTSRLASINASRKITYNIKMENVDPATMRYESQPSQTSISNGVDSIVSISKKTKVLNKKYDEDLVEENDSHDEITETLPEHNDDKIAFPNVLGVVPQKILAYEEKIAAILPSVIGCLTPTLVAVPEETLSPSPSLHVSSAVLILSNEAKNLKEIKVTCTPLNMRRLSAKKTSRGTFALNSSKISRVKNKSSSMRKSSTRLRSSVARYLRRSVKRHSSTGLAKNTDVSVNKDDGGDDESENEFLSPNGDIPIEDKIGSGNNNKKASCTVTKIFSAQNPTTISVDCAVPPSLSSTSMSSVAMSPVVSVIRLNSAMRTFDRSASAKTSCGRSSGYSSGDNARLRSKNRFPIIDSAKKLSAQRIRTQTKDVEVLVESIKIKELKSQDLLKKRDDYIKQKYEEQKRKRALRLRKALIARTERENNNAMRLKTQDEEIKRLQAIAQKKREQEEHDRQQRAAEQRRMNEQRLRERKKERERRLQLEAELHAERDANFAREERERERVKVNLLKEEERLRILAEERQKLEAECNTVKVSLINLSVKNKNNVKLVTEPQSPPHTILAPSPEVHSSPEKVMTTLNTTVTLEPTVAPAEKNTSTYDMTPQNYPPEQIPLKDPNNYDIADLGEEDSTDDESCPKKTIPSWAKGRLLKMAAIKQYRQTPNYEDIFPKQHLMQPPDLAIMFTVGKPRYYNRTSSANWSSPLYRNDDSSSP